MPNLLNSLVESDPTQPIAAELPPPGQSIVTPSSMSDSMAEAELMRRGYSPERIENLRRLGTSSPPIEDMGKYPFSDILEGGPEIAGSVAGELIGEKVGQGLGMMGMGPAGVAPGGYAGGSVGAGVGGAVGALASGDDPFAAFQRNFLASAGMRTAFSVGARVLRGFSGSVPPEGRESYEFIKDASERLGFSKHGAFVSPRAVIDNSVMDIVDNVSRNSVLGEKFYRRTDHISEEILGKAADELAHEVGKRLDAPQLMELLDQSIQGKFKADRAVYGPVFNAVDTMADERLVFADLRQMKAQAKSFVKNAKDQGGLEKGSKDYGIAERIAQFPDYMTFSEARRMRSSLMGKIRQARKDPAGEELPFARQASKSAYEALDTALADHPDIFSKWRYASSEKAKSAALKTKWVRGLIRNLDERTGGRPDLAVANLFNKGNRTGVKKLWEIVDQESKDTLQHWFIQGWLDKGLGTNGEMVGKRLVGAVEGRGGIGVDFLKTIFDDKPEVAANLLKLGRAWQKAQDRGGNTIGKTLIQLTQGGAILNWSMDDPLGAGNFGNASIVLGPYAMARLVNTRVGSKWLVEGINLPAGSEKARLLASKIASEAGRIEGERQRKMDEIMRASGPPDPNKVPRQEVSPAFSMSPL